MEKEVGRLLEGEGASWLERLKCNIGKWVRGLTTIGAQRVMSSEHRR